MTRSLPHTKDKRRQRNIIKAAQRQTDKLGIAATFIFTPEGELLVDGRTHKEINDAYDAAIWRFFKENKRFLEPDYPIQFAPSEPATIYELPVVIGPMPLNPAPRVIKFETKGR